jgi:hypothetical protein
MSSLAACSSSRPNAAPAPQTFAVQPGLPAGAAPAPQESAPSSDAAKSAGQNPSSAGSAARLVVRTAELSIVVKDVAARVTAIQDMASAMGGFVVSANLYQTTASDGSPVPQAQIVVRVPQEKLDDALKQIKQDTVDIQSETQSGQDVTDQYVDLQSRLTAKQAADQQLNKILQNATKTQDVLDVYSQIQQVESDIEVLKGQIKYTEQSAALSAITVNIIAEETVKPIQVGGWKPQGVARDAIQSLIYFWQGFVNFMIRFLLYTLPVLITIAIPLYLIFLVGRWVVRKTRKPKAQKPADTPQK